MSKIDYQALREKAEKATCGVWSLEYGEGRFDADDALIHREVVGYLPICRIEGAHPESGFDEDFQMEQQANAEFIAAANPETVLELLDEMDKWQQESSAWQAVAEKQLALAADAEKRIAELEAREISLPERSSMLHRTDFHDDYQTVMAYKVSEVIDAIRATGIRIKGE
ncbi:ead/Ea22-like family protein [Escherichia coli]|uniref:ead/Ea22-like family protein n=1 Tax=Escherichia coli TaxID=562 RepID=UPI000DDA8B1F|nr:ead/Ea22-like family protein [Escherichia coli]HAV7900311.1 ead/Ea22-like family protein [Escherichia coli]